MFDPSIVNTKSASINEDIKLIKEFSQSSVDQRIDGPSHMSELTSILKARNDKYKYGEQAKRNVLQWIKQKGSDITPLVTKVKNLKMHEQRQQVRHSSESDCYFYMSDISYSNQKQYIKKNFEYGIFSAMQLSMSKRNYRRSLAEKFLDQKKHNIRAKNRKAINVPIVNLHSRNPDKKMRYVRSTQSFFNSSNLLPYHKWIQIYRANSGESFWDIIHRHINIVSENKVGNRFIAMAICSLKMIENEYNSELPSNHENILENLNRNYLYAMNNQRQSYIRDGNYGAIWGKLFLLYRSGRKQDFYSSIQQEPLRNAFRDADKSIQNLKPVKVDIEKLNINDVFYDQLYYALRGIPKYASINLCQTNSMDICWIMLRNIAIFGDKPKLEQLREQLFKQYEGPFMNQIQVKNLLYLIGYQQLMLAGPNDVMDQDDYLHFLIVVYYNYHLLELDENKKEALQKKLNEHIVNYIHQLLLEGSNEYVYYMLLIPEHQLANEVSSIIASSRLLQQINWSLFKKKLPLTIYESLINQSLSKHALLYQQYLNIAKMQCDLVDRNDLAIQFLLEMNARAALNYNFNKNQLNSAFILKQQIFQKKPNLKIQYQPVFQLFEENTTLYDLIKERDQNKLSEFLKKSQHYLISEQLRHETRRAIDKLIAADCFQCYFIFIRNTIKATQIALIKKNQIKQLREIQNLILLALDSLLNTEPYRSKADKTSAQEIKRMLFQSIHRIE